MYLFFSFKYLTMQGSYVYNDSYNKPVLVMYKEFDKNKVLYSNGNLEAKSKQQVLFVIIIKPKFGCSTKEIYKNVKKYSPKK